jgi:hypothetical protein
MLFTLARCILITSRNGSRFMYQPGQAAPGMLSAAVTPKPVLNCVGDGAQGLALFGYAGGLEIGFSAHDGGHAGGIVASGIAVVGQAGGH